MNSLRRFLPAAAALALAPLASAGDTFLHPPVVKTPLTDRVQAATDEAAMLAASESSTFLRASTPVVFIEPSFSEDGAGPPDLRVDSLLPASEIK